MNLRALEINLAGRDDRNALERLSEQAGDDWYGMYAGNGKRVLQEQRKMQVQQQDASDIIVPAAAAWQRENSDDPDIPVAVAMEAAPTMDEINMRANPMLTSQQSAPLKDDWSAGAPTKPIEPPQPRDLASQLQKLAELHSMGALGDGEFQEAKRQVLGTAQPPPQPGSRKLS